jgi:hypothetical protein
LLRYQRRTQQPDLEQLTQLHRILEVGLAGRDLLDVPSVYQQQLDIIELLNSSTYQIGFHYDPVASIHDLGDLLGHQPLPQHAQLVQERPGTCEPPAGDPHHQAPARTPPDFLPVSSAAARATTTSITSSSNRPGTARGTCNQRD